MLHCPQKVCRAHAAAVHSPQLLGSHTGLPRRGHAGLTDRRTAQATAETRENGHPNPKNQHFPRRPDASKTEPFLWDRAVANSRQRKNRERGVAWVLSENTMGVVCCAAAVGSRGASMYQGQGLPGADPAASPGPPGQNRLALCGCSEDSCSCASICGTCSVDSCGRASGDMDDSGDLGSWSRS